MILFFVPAQQHKDNSKLCFFSILNSLKEQKEKKLWTAMLATKGPWACDDEVVEHKTGNKQVKTDQWKWFVTHLWQACSHGEHSRVVLPQNLFCQEKNALNIQ